MLLARSATPPPRSYHQERSPSHLRHAYYEILPASQHMISLRGFLRHSE